MAEFVKAWRTEWVVRLANGSFFDNFTSEANAIAEAMTVPGATVEKVTKYLDNVKVVWPTVEVIDVDT